MFFGGGEEKGQQEGRWVRQHTKHGLSCAAPGTTHSSKGGHGLAQVQFPCQNGQEKQRRRMASTLLMALVLLLPAAAAVTVAWWWCSFAQHPR
jgi:hypothetical protein